MKKFEVDIKKIQFITVTIEAESVRQAIDKAEEPDNASWYPWNEAENITYDVTHIREIPNKQ